MMRVFVYNRSDNAHVGSSRLSAGAGTQGKELATFMNEKMPHSEGQQPTKAAITVLGMAMMALIINWLRGMLPSRLFSFVLPHRGLSVLLRESPLCSK